jgi:hypothetical protein
MAIYSSTRAELVYATYGSRGSAFLGEQRSTAVGRASTLTEFLPCFQSCLTDGC